MDRSKDFCPALWLETAAAAVLFVFLWAPADFWETKR